MTTKQKMVGTVLSLFPNKGFGFIRGSDRITRFMHVSSFINRTEFDMLNIGERVLFVPVMDTPEDNARGNGMRATEIEVVHDAKGR